MVNDERDDSSRSDGGTTELFDRISDQLSRRGFLGNTAKVGGGALALSAGTGVAAAGGTESGSGGEEGMETLTGLTTKTNGKKPETGGFEEFGDRAFVVRENPEGGIPSHVKVACEGEKRTRYHVYQMFYEGDEPKPERESYLLIKGHIETGNTYEFVGEAEECPGEEKPPFEFLKVSLRPAEMDSDGEEMEEVSDLDVLNFALSLEHLEATYYNEFLEEYSESDVERSEAARVFADPGSRFSTYQKIEEVRDHEEAHVEALTGTIEELGGEPVEPLEYDFPYETIEDFVALSATIEAVGVSAYAGAAPLIESDAVLEAAASIVSVEARHTSYFNVLNTTSPFPNAFDEPRTMEEVLEIASQFIVDMDGEEMGQDMGSDDSGSNGDDH